MTALHFSRGRFHQGGGRCQQSNCQALWRYRNSDLSKGERKPARVALLVQDHSRLHILTVNCIVKPQSTWSALSAAALLLICVLCPVWAEPRLKERAPPLTITASGGRDFDLDAMRGKVVLVVFWATWCGPCLEKMPALEKYYREHKADGFEVIALQHR